jgi:dTDP-4-dehydrorhamnose 3,5-epimerase
MRIIKTKFKNLKVISSLVNKDKRGNFREIFKKKILKKKDFPFICASTSKKNVLRGLHLQTRNPQGKFITVLKGEIYDVALDLRKKSKTFCKYFSINLSEKNGLSIYIPPGFAHGFIALKADNIIVYSCTNYRSKKHEIGIKWNDKDANIKWPNNKPIISRKDKQNISLAKYKKIYA